MKVINDIVAEKFDRGISELIHAREKLFLKFKKLKLHIDKENYKKS